MLWRQCWCQKCFQWGPGKGKQMAAVTGEHGWLLVQWSAVQSCWAGCAWGESDWQQGGRACAEALSFPLVLQSLCAPWCPHEHSHTTWLHWLQFMPAQVPRLQICTGLHCLFNSGFFSVPGNDEVSFWYLCCLDLYKPLFPRWLLKPWGFYKTWWPGWRDSISVDWSASVNAINFWVF